MNRVDSEIGTYEKKTQWVYLNNGTRALFGALRNASRFYTRANSTTINDALNSVLSPYRVDRESDQYGIFIGGTGQHMNGLGNVERLYNLYEGSKFYYGGIGNNTDESNNATNGFDGGTANGWSEILDRIIADVEKYRLPGQKVSIFGWSRGAAMSNELARMLLARNIDVHFLGMYDPVYSKALPGQQSLIARASFDGWLGNYVTSDIPSNVFAAAVFYAANEDRSFFPATKFETTGPTFAHFVRSPGGHGEVGGHFQSNMVAQQLNLRAMVDIAKQHGGVKFQFAGIDDHVLRIMKSKTTLAIIGNAVDDEDRAGAIKAWRKAADYKNWIPYSDSEYHSGLLRLANPVGWKP
ncbi:MAG: hypothetical protein AAFP90_20505, partial [Planctomycetota bacterium]